MSERGCIYKPNISKHLVKKVTKPKKYKQGIIDRKVKGKKENRKSIKPKERKK